MAYLEKLRRSADVDQELVQAGWEKTTSIDSDREFSRLFKAKDVALAFFIRSNPLGSGNLSKPEPSCLLATQVSDVTTAQSLVKLSNSIVGLREVTPFRYTNRSSYISANPPKINVATIGYGQPDSKGMISVVTEMYSGPPSPNQVP